ncbi:MAG TPA: methyltransferase domain-containing protein [Terracidiphilus sp.]|jgi:SAM-dependent methyltransferase
MTASSVAPRGTFRDPAGSLYFDETKVLRHVRPAFVAEAESFLNSPLAKKWMASGRMVTTTIADRDADGSLLLEHERIVYPTYPWEWTPGQWAAAGELTLDFCEESLAAGLILKDATPLNVLFRNADPVFVDVLSFDKRTPGNPIWLAYGQFVRTFLLPLAANRYLGWPLAASIERRDGYEPTDLYPHLPLRRRWTAPLRSLVTLPHLLEGKANAAASTGASPVRQQPPEVATQVLRGTLKKLRRTLHALTPAPHTSRWSDYTTTASHYTAEDHARKAAFVERALAQAAPHSVLDVGGNTGHYSRIAVAAGARVVAWDTDVQAADANWREARTKHEPILPLIANIARPTPAVGWQNQESLSLLQRSEGAFDGIMMLGVIHHMLLIDQIPLPAIFDLVRRLTTRWAVIEWVPATDSQFQQLCRGRQDIYGHLDEAAFLAAADQHFVRRLVENLPNGRSLWLFETK